MRRERSETELGLHQVCKATVLNMIHSNKSEEVKMEDIPLLSNVCPRTGQPDTFITIQTRILTKDRWCP
jgi:NADPH-dependent 7-cyano-7-deazaguanine reductase QueF